MGISESALTDPCDDRLASPLLYPEHARLHFLGLRLTDEVFVIPGQLFDIIVVFDVLEPISQVSDGFDIANEWTATCVASANDVGAVLDWHTVVVLGLLDLNAINRLKERLV